MKFPLTLQLVEEARRFELRSACRDCAFWLTKRNECLHGWPDEGQRRWPLDVDQAGTAELPDSVSWCKEFELR